MLTELSLENWRIVNTSLTFSPGINVIWGDNGSGKSSILEAIHFFAFGRSFRTSQADMIIGADQDFCAAHAVIQKEGLPYPISVVRHQKKTQARLSGDPVPLSRIAPYLPALFVDCDSHRSYFGTRSFRLRLLDWLVFHVEPGYIDAMRLYNQGLKQRNWALKQGLDPVPWNVVLDKEAAVIQACRDRVSKLVAAEIASQGVFEGLLLQYMPGFDVSKGLLADLEMSQTKDLRLRRTTVGPHLGDWCLVVEGKDAGQVLSQGQQKTTFLKLMFIQYAVMCQQGLQPLVMIDDLAAELDSWHRELIGDFLSTSGAQAILTGVLARDVEALEGAAMFHVKHGCLT